MIAMRSNAHFGAAQASLDKCPGVREFQLIYPLVARSKKHDQPDETLVMLCRPAQATPTTLRTERGVRIKPPDCSYNHGPNSNVYRTMKAIALLGAFCRFRVPRTRANSLMHTQAFASPKAGTGNQTRMSRTDVTAPPGAGRVSQGCRQRVRIFEPGSAHRETSLISGRSRDPDRTCRVRQHRKAPVKPDPAVRAPTSAHDPRDHAL